MNIKANPVFPTPRTFGASLSYQYQSPAAYVPPPPPVHTVGTPSSPPFNSSFGVPRANPVTVVRSPFSTSGGNLGRPIATPAPRVSPITQLQVGLFS